MHTFEWSNSSISSSRFNVNYLFALSLNVKLSGATNPGQSGPGSNGIEGVLCILQSSISGHILGGEAYLSTEKLLVYCDTMSWIYAHTCIHTCVCTPIHVCVCIYIRSRTCVYTHTRLHTHTHTYTHIYMWQDELDSVWVSNFKY